MLDDTLYSSSLKGELKDGGKIIVNSKNVIEGALVYDAESIAAEFRLPVVNTVMLGLLAGVSGVVTPEEAKEAVKGYMPAKLVERNTGALLKALQEVSE